MLYTLMVILYVIVCLFLIAVVLLQTGKRADLAGAFGGGGSQTAFGTRGAATFLSRMTTVFAVLFMVLSLALSIYSSGGGRGSGSVLDKMPTGSSAPAPMDPGNNAPREETGLPTNVPATPQQNQAPVPQAPPTK
jgi:preprotein translocase subunit SecG